jgi:hypothetical protein
VGVLPFPVFVACLVLLLRLSPSPFLWAMTAVYLGLAVVFAALLVWKLVRVRNAPADQKGLWLSASELGFTDLFGRTRTCPRHEVTSSLKVIIPITQPMKELLVFKNAAGAVVLSVPLSLGRQEVIAPVCADLGIDMPHLKYINTTDAATESLPGFPLGRVKHTWRRQDTKLLLVTVIGVTVALASIALFAIR